MIYRQGNSCCFNSQSYVLRRGRCNKRKITILHSLKSCVTLVDSLIVLCHWSVLLDMSAWSVQPRHTIRKWKHCSQCQHHSLAVQHSNLPSTRISSALRSCFVIWNQINYFCFMRGSCLQRNDAMHSCNGLFESVNEEHTGLIIHEDLKFKLQVFRIFAITTSLNDTIHGSNILSDPMILLMKNIFLAWNCSIIISDTQRLSRISPCNSFIWIKLFSHLQWCSNIPSQLTLHWYFSCFSDQVILQPSLLISQFYYVEECEPMIKSSFHISHIQAVGW